MRRRFQVTALALVVSSVATADGQQLRKRDTTPFERPKSVATVKSPSNPQTLGELKALVETNGFAVTAVQWTEGTLDASRKDPQVAEGADRVLLWLERDPDKPLEQARIYVMYGRFEKFFGSSEGPVRVVMYDSELARMTTLLDRIAAYAVNHP